MKRQHEVRLKRDRRGKLGPTHWPTKFGPPFNVTRRLRPMFWNTINRVVQVRENDDDKVLCEGWEGSSEFYVTKGAQRRGEEAGKVGYWPLGYPNSGDESVHHAAILNFGPAPGAIIYGFRSRGEAKRWIEFECEQAHIGSLEKPKTRKKSKETDLPEFEFKVEVRRKKKKKDAQED